MSNLKRFFRLLKILWALRKYGMARWLASAFPCWHFQLLCAFDGHRHTAALTERAAQLRITLENLGPIFVKFGQLLSTREDLLAKELIVELSKLQDQVPAFPTETFINIIEQAFHQPLSSLFTDFQTIPLGSASIAQVHAARLFTGEEVVIKILRPNIREQILQDVAVLELLAHYAEKMLPYTRRLHPRAVVAEFHHTLMNELDLMREGANAAQLRKNFLNTHLLYVPKIYWDYTHPHILVLERIHGIQINDLAQLRAKKTNLKKLAENGVEIFFTQVFRDCFFHADMHPGNVFVNVENPNEPKYVAVDFGIMGALNYLDQRYLAENFLAFFNQDYRRVAELHVESGWVPPYIRVDDFESAIRAVCEPIFEKPLKDISFGQTLLRLFQTAQRFEMEVQPQLILLQKTLLTIEGVGRQLYPDLDLWKTAKPYLERWMRERLSPRRLYKQLRKQMPYWVERWTTMPPAQPPSKTPPLFINSSHTLPPTRSFSYALLGSACIIAGSLLLCLTDPLKLLLGTFLFTLGALASLKSLRQ